MGDIKIRCSNLGKLYTNPKKKSGLISLTCLSMLKEIYLEEKYGYKEEVVTKEMKKGHLCEAQSRDLVRKVLGGEYRKRNEIHYENDYIKGTPDNDLEKEPIVEDIKNSYNLRTFMNAELTKSYEMQLMGYCWLRNKPKGRLIYTINPTPYEILEEEKKSLYFKFDCDEQNPDYINMCNQIDINNAAILELKDEERVKVFDIELTDEFIKETKERVIVSRDVYKELGL